MNRRLLLALAIVGGLSWGAVAAGANEPRERATSDWNDGAIDWKGYREGMDFVQILDKPGILVFYTTWCPHCKNYSWVFHDPEVVKLSKQFVMIRVDKDAEKALNDRYGRHGTYVPRTFFVGKDGEVDWAVHGLNSGYPYFLDEYDPAELRGLMQRVLGAAASGGDAPRP
jgi:thiol-disulfide isomerase/thioredoxin